MSGRSPLHEINQRLGARFVDFGGWDMPVQYGSIIDEHHAVRSSCGVFDVSHLGRFLLRGEGATTSIARIFTNDVDELDAGRTTYGMVMNENAGIIDDVVVWKWAADDLWVLPNAANADRVMGLVTAPPVPQDLRPETAMMAIQGPSAPGVLEEVFGSAPRRFRTQIASFDDHPVHMAGTGYTGERGGEVVMESDIAEAVMEALVAAGATPCGLGARDTLRLEAGLALWGQDLDETVTPLEAGLDFAIDWDHDFVGRPALDQQRETGLGKQLVAFITEGRLIPRHGHVLRSGDSTGAVTSGNYSPTLGHGIAMGYLSPPNDDELEVEIRGTWHPVDRVELPFLSR